MSNCGTTTNRERTVSPAIPVPVCPREVNWTVESALQNETRFHHPNDPAIIDSIAVLDQVLKRDRPQRPGWRRDNPDGHGQAADGSAYDGTGAGRCWLLLTGERAHYEMATGRDPLPTIAAIADSLPT